MGRRSTKAPRRAPIGVRSSARSQVYELIREAIVSLELLPGQALSEVELANHYGVSRTPVREALIRLGDAGLVEVVPQVGTFVARISVRDVTEAQFIREALERASLPGVVDRVTEVDAARLRDLLDVQRRAVASGDQQLFFVADEDLHRALLEIAGHTKVWPVVQSIKGHLDRVRRLSLPEPQVLEQLIIQHTAIVDHVLRKDHRAADEVLTRHLRLVIELLGPLGRRHPDYFLHDEDLARAPFQLSAT
ncbi:MAG: FCD domain-containing protein [Micromonosporaceae bacterium]|nr:FCD domain-containing protein [Micromonosporaceae bacterium]